jgi:hypothetical protein
MQPLTIERLQAIAAARGIEYDAPSYDDPKIVTTRMARVFPIPQGDAFQFFADPANHAKHFSIIKGTTAPIRVGIEGMLTENEFFALEHVEEANVPPRLMFVRYRLEPPHTIIKEAVTNPFAGPGEEVEDKKKGKVVIRFEQVDDASTRLITESTFQATTGATFVRGFVDHVWLSFFENMLVETGELAANQRMTEI